MADDIVKRKRGGASMPCPKCGANSRVLKTRRLPSMGDITESTISRDRKCLKRDHDFKTIEKYAAE